MIYIIFRDPTLINMLRASEIILSFITESIYHKKLPEYLSVIGKTIVILPLFFVTIITKEVENGS